MAFLDNSGDIILDAVLTEEGRRRMAGGNFAITKFALGDDEINYMISRMLLVLHTTTWKFCKPQFCKLTRE